MKLEDQVVSLELAKKMKFFGFDQESQFIWYRPKALEIPFELSLRGHQIHPKNKKNEFIDFYEAYTVAELGDMFPARGEEEWLSTNIGFNYEKRRKEYVCEFCSFMSEDDYESTKDVDPFNFLQQNDNTIHVSAETEADARAKMLIHLKEEGLI